MPNISTLGQSLDQIARLKIQQGQVDLLTTQIATGKKTQLFSGLGVDVLQSKRARADITALETYTDNIKHADRRIKLMIAGVQDIKAQARTIQQSLVSAVQQGDYPDFATTQDLSGNVTKFIANVMNLKDGDRYLFAGASADVKPINDTGVFESFLGEFVPDEADLTNPPLISSGVVGDWGDGTITTDQFIANYRNVNETLLGYSDTMTTNTSGKTFVRVDDDSEFDYTVLANTDGFKEILSALKVLGGLPPPEYAPGALNDPTATTFAEDTAPFPPTAKQENFFAVINDLSNMISNALDKLDGETFKLSQVQAQITKIKTSHAEDISTLSGLVADAEDVDLTETVAKVNQLRVSLEASYKVTGLISQLTLVNFL